MDVDGVLEIAAELFRLFLGQCVPRNDCVTSISRQGAPRGGISPRLTFESLFDVDSLLGARLEVGNVALGGAEGRRSLTRDLLRV